MDFINNIMFWIIGFFVMVILFIMMLVILILIKMKTNAITELKAFFKKKPVSIFFEDGKFVDFKVCKEDAGLIYDKDYGCFIKNEKNAYLGKRSRNVYHVYDTGFAPGINIKAAQVAEEIKEALQDDDTFYAIGTALANGTLKDERFDCLRSSINTSHLKQLYNCIEPHSINASVEKKVAKQVNKMNSKTNLEMLWVFIIGLGGVVCGFILLKMFNVG